MGLSAPYSLLHWQEVRKDNTRLQELNAYCAEYNNRAIETAVGLW